jgi:hypothetical protein
MVSFNQTVRTQFNKGLLTEFSELNFPEEASIDELNCDLFKAGNRTKRKGFSPEVGSSPASGPFQLGSLFHTATWTNVGGDPSVEFLVVQSGGKIRFYRKGSAPMSEQSVKTSSTSETIYQLNLNPYSVVGGLGSDASKIDVASFDGDLVIVSPQINPIRVEYNTNDGTFSVEQIEFRIRDFEWQGQRELYAKSNGEEFVGPGRKYDTKNCGWADGPNDIGDTVLNSYISAKAAWPPLTHPWFSGKDSNGNFQVATWEKVYSGTSLIGNGQYTLDLWDRNREEVSGVTGVPNELITDRFATIAAYAGRAWYAGFDSRVYYSQILEDNNQLGELLQSNDPTSEESSDVLATDGGYINLPEANGIRKLHAFGSSLLVFADNGVWRISGIDGNLFKADDFSVYKITDFGLAYRTSLVAGQNSVPFWWSYTGIHTIQVTDAGGLVEVNVSRDTIQSFWENIDAEAKTFVTGTYDAFNNRVVWLYPEDDETVEYKFRRLLFLDVDLGAFFPWEVADNGNTYICGTSFFNGSGSSSVTFNVVDSNGDIVQDTNGNDVVVERTAGTVRSSEIYFLIRTENNEITFGLFDRDTYYDWGDQPYDAYAESAYNFIGDLGRRKTSPYITVFMRQTEMGFTDQGGGTYSAIDESSLNVSAFWDFKKNPSSTQQQAYRHKTPVLVNVNDLSDFPTPTTVLTTRLKLRGRGRVVKIRFEGVPGKGFNLLGWETLDARKDTY